MKKTTERAAWIVGSAVAGAALVGIGVALTSKPAAASPTLPTGGSAGGTQHGGGGNPPHGPGFGPKLFVAGPYTQVQSGTLQTGEDYLLEVPPQAGETYATFAQYLAKKGVAPGPVKATQSFDVMALPTGWPTTNTSAWKYVVHYGTVVSKNVKGSPPWSITSAFPGALVWATQGSKV